MPDNTERLLLLISERRIRARIATLARRIDADYRGRTLCLVVVLKGAFVFAADLARQLATPSTTDFISASSYGTGTRSSGKVALGGTDALQLDGKHVLVVEDILDTGRTGAAILDLLHRQGPASLALCTLLRKPAAGAPDVAADYVGFDIGHDFVVGYGMDYAERHRNLRAIYRLIPGGGGWDQPR